MPLQSKKRVLVVSEMGGPDTVKGVQKFLLTHSGYQPYMCLIYQGSAADVRHIKRMIIRTRPDGILAPMFRESRAVLESACLPLVNISDSIRTSLPTVILDQRRMGQMAAEHLLGQGLKSFAYGVLKTGYYAEIRWQGFRETLEKAGFPCLLFDDFSPGVTVGNISDDLVRQWVAQLPKPVGIHLSFTVLAMQVVWACQELGLNVPADVAILGGMDWPVMTTMWAPTLSAFEAPFWRQGYEGMKLLDHLIKGGKPPLRPILIPPGGIIQRQTTDSLSIKDPAVAQVLQFVRENAHRSISVKDLLEHVPLSRRALERRFEKVMGHGLHDEIVRARMERAKMLLRETALPVGQVGIQSGFSSYPFFSAFFRKHTGQTPREYRHRSLNLEK